MKDMSIRKTFYSVFAAFMALGFTMNAYGLDISIDIAPNTLNIQSQGEVVTVHTDIAYWTVDVYSVYLNGVLISSWKADNRGNFVAKFLLSEIKTLDGLVIGDYNNLQLVGLTDDGDAFSGDADILVIDVVAKGKKR